MPTKQEETEFLALLVHRGHLSREQGLRCFQAFEKGRRLEEALAAEGFSSERIARLRRTRAGELPEIPGYEIQERVGSGATAEVYRAADLKAGRTVAVKVLHRELAIDVIGRTRFLREAKLLLELEHENIVKGFRLAKTRPPDVPPGPEGDLYFFVMEFIDGATLLELISRKKTFPEDTALFIVLQAARGLEYMKSRSVVHKDIKPGNIMITRENRVKLIDLGFASSASEGEEMRKDSTLGTVQYISPEQAQGLKNLDSRADIYSLGVTLYHLVVGQLPFTGSDDSEILRKQIVESLSSPALKNRSISPHMHYFIEKMMAKEREIRYQDPRELIGDIERTIRGKKTLEFHPNATPDVEPPKDLFKKGKGS